MPYLMPDWIITAKLLESGHVSDWISGIIGAVGAILGSVVTVSWTEFFGWRNRRRDDRRQAYSAALSIYHKLNKIYSGSLIIHRHYADFLDKYQDLTGPKCLCFQAMIISDAPAWFTTEDRLGIMLSRHRWYKKNDGLDLLNCLQDLDDQYHHLLSCVARYGLDRQNFLNNQDPAMADGIVGTSFGANASQILAANSLDLMIDQTFPIAEKVANSALNALKMLVYLQGKLLGKKFSIKIHDINGEELKLNARESQKFKKTISF